MCAAPLHQVPRCCTLGFPRIGAHRQLKRALEAFWDGASSEEQLLTAVHATEAAALTAQRDAGAWAC
jgi:5-methyltetrahydropteroyltriglutamate--homocysteine methyltransferase